MKHSAEQLALWLAKNQPNVFKVMVIEANKRGQLGGITDWLSGIGSTVGAAAKSVGSFLTSREGLSALTAVGGVYLQSRAQKDALKIQIAQAQQGLPPAPIQSVGVIPSTQTPIYVDPTTGQQYPLTPQIAQSLMPQTNFSQYVPWMIGGGFALALVFAFRRN